MPIALQDFIDIADKAVCPDEWAKQSARAPDLEDTSQAAQMLERWKSLVTLHPQRNHRDFERRLESLGLNQALALERLRHRGHFTAETLPFWARKLQEILDQAIYPLPAALQSHLIGIPRYKAPLFPEILHPFLNHYARIVRGKTPDWPVLMAPVVWDDLLQELLLRLSALAARVIAADVKQKSVLGRLQGKTPADRYQYYTTQVVGTANGLVHLLQKYPVLARLLVTTTEQAIITTSCWLQRLADDKLAITETFAGGIPIGLVTGANPGLSDPHNGGQTVWYVKFESGLQLAYKPRSLIPDIAYLNFLHWLNHHQPTLTLKAAPVLARSGYGWVQWIEASECDSKEDAALYYRRQGAHIALLYFLSGIDFHEENFVAAGSFPIPIDLETLGAWALTQTSPESTHDIINQLPYFWRTYDSIFSTAMLPRWINHEEADVEALMMSALSERGDKDVWPLPIPVWHNLETDKISLTFEQDAAKPTCPFPHYQGEPISAAAHVDDILEGFVQTYQTIVVHQADLLGSESPLEGFKGLPTRALIRPTQTYADLLFFTTAPDNLVSGAAYDVALEMVCGIPIIDEGREGALTYSRVEKRALWARDIPYFIGSTSDCYLYAESGDRFGPINTFSGYDNIRKRVQTASEIDLHWQRELLRTSMVMMLVPRGALPKPSVFEVFPPTPALETTVVRHLYSHTLEIAQHIDNQVLHHVSGIGWLTLGLYDCSGIPEVSHSFPWETIGNTGIAIFLVNLAAYTQDEHWAGLAQQAIQTTVSLIEQEKLQASLAQSGLYCGIAGVLYGLQTCAIKLENKEYLQQAHRLALSVSLETWGNVQNPDIVGGASANLLALLHLYDAISDDAILERAVAVGHGILSHQEQTGPDAGGFYIPHVPRPLLGMGHGVAGIVYALSKLYAITSDSTLESAIRQGLAYERSRFDDEYQDWPSLFQEPDEPQFMAGFCGGAAGLGLARLKMLRYYQDDEMLAEIETACQATLDQAGTGAAGHHLCCGEASRIIFLCRAAQQLQRNDLFDAAVLAAEKMLAFYEQKGYWRLGGLKVRSIIPGLTDGVAGIGLSLLTVLDPEGTSCFLSLS